jgi:hypothetical protein
LSIDLTSRWAARSAALLLLLGGCAAGAVLTGAAAPGHAPQPAAPSHAAPAALVAAARGAGIELAPAPAPSGPVSFTATSRGAAVAIPSQGLTAHVGADGVLRTGAAGDPGDAWELVPVGVGRARLIASHPGAPKIAGAHVTQPLGGGVSAWYHATEGGLEQGFTIARRPQGRWREPVHVLASGDGRRPRQDDPGALRRVR